MNWLRQFETDELTDATLLVLEHIQMIGRREIVAALRRFLQDRAHLRAGSLCPLGEPKDSAAILTYYADDVAPDFDLKIRSLPEALVEPGPIVLVDDFIGSGGQAVSFFQNQFDAERTTDLHEERESPLPAPLRDALRDRNIGVVFAGAPGGALGSSSES